MEGAQATLDVGKLKARAYDLIRVIERCQRELAQVNEYIQRLEKSDGLPNVQRNEGNGGARDPGLELNQKKHDSR